MTLLLASLLTASAQDLDEAVGQAPEAVDLSGAVFSGDAIINGSEYSEDEYPMAGAMLMSITIPNLGGISSFACSSTLIAPDVVLIAAHCVDKDFLEQSITGGVIDLDSLGAEILFYWSRQADLSDYNGSSFTGDVPPDAIEVTATASHPDFDFDQINSLGGLGVNDNNDIALMFLSEAVEDVPHAYLPTADEATQLEEGSIVEIVGWGYQQPHSGQPSGPFAIKVGGESVIGELGDYEFQVGPEEDDARKCNGDSGGPTFMDVETNASDSLRVIGVTSHAYDTTLCATKGGVDTRVDAFLEWIDDEMTGACDDGTRVWCDGETGIIEAPTPVSNNNSGDDDKNGRAGCSAVAASSGALIAGLSLLVSVSRRRRDG